MKKLIGVLIPTIFLAIVYVIFHIEDVYKSFDFEITTFKTFEILGIFFIFPFIFILSGIYCAIINANWIISIVLSLLSYSTYMFVFADTSVLGFIVFYLMIYTFIYFLTKEGLEIHKKV